MVLRKGYYIVVSGSLATWHETLSEAQEHLHLFLQRMMNVEAYICEVFPRERGTHYMKTETL